MKRCGIITIGFFFILLSSCCKEEIPEQLPASLQELISQNVNCSCDPYINLYRWERKLVYVLGYSGPTCSWAPAYFNDQGEPINMDQDYSFNEFLADSELVKRAWTCGQP